MSFSYETYNPVDLDFAKKAALLGRSEREIKEEAGVFAARPDPIEAEVGRIMNWFGANKIKMRNTTGVVLREQLESGGYLTLGQGYAYATTRWDVGTGKLQDVDASTFRERFRAAPPAVALGGICVRQAACGQGFAYELASRAMERFDDEVRLIDPDGITALLLSGALDSCDNTAERLPQPVAADYTLGDFRHELSLLQ